jgi:phage shock protein PspC (stress-responsive transcriptional regulator)
MLRCSIALAACGANSQLTAREVARIPNLCRRTFIKRLESLHFLNWHGSCSVKQYKLCEWSEQMEAQVNEVALPLRSHTILGVCEAVGEDFGFNPVLLRIPFAASVIYSPMLAVGAYLGLGLIVLASRLLFPRAKPAEAVTEQAPANEPHEYAEAA